jgi:hypothetical protein
VLDGPAEASPAASWALASCPEPPSLRCVPPDAPPDELLDRWTSPASEPGVAGCWPPPDEPDDEDEEEVDPDELLVDAEDPEEDDACGGGASSIVDASSGEPCTAGGVVNWLQ